MLSTGLPNRALFAERLEEALRGHRPTAASPSCSSTWTASRKSTTPSATTPGDAILREVAQRLGPLDQDGNLVARLGGDEFAVLHVGALEDEAIFDKAEQIVATICQPLGVEGLLLDVRASLGVAVSLPNSHDATGLAAPRRHSHVRGQRVGRRGPVLRPGRGPLDSSPAPTGHRTAPGNRAGGPRRLVPARGAA